MKMASEGAAETFIRNDEFFNRPRLKTPVDSDFINVDSSRDSLRLICVIELLSLIHI